MLNAQFNYLCKKCGRKLIAYTRPKGILFGVEVFQIWLRCEKTTAFNSHTLRFFSSVFYTQKEVDEKLLEIKKRADSELAQLEKMKK